MAKCPFSRRRAALASTSELFPSPESAWNKILRDEVCFYCYLNKRENLLPHDIAMDFQIHQKLLPRVYGGEEMRPLLEEFGQYCEAKFPMSHRKIMFMLQRLDHGFTSFWV